MWGLITDYLWQEGDVHEGSATIVDRYGSGGGGTEEYRNGTGSGTGPGGYECYEIWKVWPDGYEEYTGVDICFEDEE